MTDYYGGVELGGTKTLVLLAEGDRIVARRSIPTGQPQDTLHQAAEQLRDWNRATPFTAVGIASFGPLQLKRDAPDFGRMLPTPKPGWAGADIAGTLTGGLDCPWAIDTDVNGAALAEYRWGAGKGSTSLCYITIGTGLGGGVLAGGVPVHGAMHPEVGHIRIRREAGDGFAGACPFHGDCVEGLVAGPALAARFGARMEDVRDDDPRWRDVASDIAELIGTLLLTTAAERILFGGSVATRRPFLLPMARDRALERLAGYLPAFTPDSAADMVRLAGLGDDAGPYGAIALAQAARPDI
ncbi:MAG: fructokinase [Sphingobium sp.]|nr:MAG: fructokinase [Sphingobium sp.]